MQRSAHPLPGTVGALLPALVHPPLLPEPLRERAEPYRAERPRSVGWAIAACLAARTDVLRRLGPFDARQFLFFEDMDLCLRARAAGIPTVLDPRVRVRHLGGHATGPPTRASRTSCSPAAGARSWPRTAVARRAALDDLAQALTFAIRAAARRALGRTSDRERAQLAALVRTRAE